MASTSPGSALGRCASTGCHGPHRLCCYELSASCTPGSLPPKPQGIKLTRVGGSGYPQPRVGCGGRARRTPHEPTDTRLLHLARAAAREADQGVSPVPGVVREPHDDSAEAGADPLHRPPPGWRSARAAGRGQARRVRRCDQLARHRAADPQGLRGRVVLVDFWTYTRVNWLRTLGYRRAWAAKYADAGLTLGTP